MASTSLAGNNCYHVRSISLPSRSHPPSLRVEEGLHKLKTWATSSLLQASSPTADLLCVGLRALEEMYDCVEELLQLPHTQQALARHQRETWAAKELDSSLRLLDICGAIRDAVSSMKEQSQGLRTTLRTRGSGDSFVQGKLCAFVNTRKKTHKDSIRCLKTLKQMEASYPAHPLSAPDQDLSLVLRGREDLRERSPLLSSSPSRPSCLSQEDGSQPQEPATESKAPVSWRRWRLLCILSAENVQGRMPDLGRWWKRHKENCRGWRLEWVAFEMGLEPMFRQLIQNRVGSPCLTSSAYNS